VNELDVNRDDILEGPTPELQADERELVEIIDRMNAVVRAQNQRLAWASWFPALHWLAWSCALAALTLFGLGLLDERFYFRWPAFGLLISGLVVGEIRTRLSIRFVKSLTAATTEIEVINAKLLARWGVDP
jgi:hypothetical protein